jgi:hypothetical protein
VDDRILSYDVVVVGGGAAGLAAALGATRAGAHTALVERYGFLGGMATAGLVSTICGLYSIAPGGGPELLNEGFPAEFARLLTAQPGCEKPVRRGRSFVLPYTGFAFACLADELTTTAPDLDVYLHTYLADASTRGAQVDALAVTTWERRFELRAGAVIDASGDAMVAHRAGAATAMPPASVRQLPSLVFVLQHVEREALAPGPRVALLRTIVAAERDGRLPRGSSNVAFGLSPQPGEVIGKLALNDLAAEIDERRDFLTAAEQTGRRRVAVLVEFLQTLPAFARAFVSHVAPQVGVRESRRVVGRYELTREDVLAGRQFPDGVARACWPIELWEDGQLGPSYEWLEDGQSYQIPLRCLESKDFANLFGAGRCISATHEAVGSARVIGTCLATGEAAGIAAARRAAEGSPRPA